MSELPAGWARASLGEVTSEPVQRVPTKSEEFTYIDIASVDRGTKEIAAPQRLRGDKAPSRARKVVQTGDVLVSMTRPNLNAVARVPKELDGQIASTGFDVLRPLSIDSRYLFSVVRSQHFVQAMSDLVQGALYPAVRARDVRSYLAPMAPLPEQRRIADKLDAVLARVDACRARLDRVPQILKRFREAVLEAAVSGRLTEEWRGGPASWHPTRLGKLFKEDPRNGFSPKSVDRETGVRTLTLTATTSGRFLAHCFKYIDAEIPETSHLWLYPGDILIQRGNTIEYVGISAIYDGPPAGFIYPDLMMKCRASELVETKFLHCLLLSKFVRRFFRERASGTAGNMPKINQQTVTAAPVSLPPIDEQREIVRRVDELFTLADSLERRYREAVASVDKLTPAVLAKAFRAKLVPQDPNDEPASVLLDRIRQQRAQNATVPASRPQRAAVRRGRQQQLKGGRRLRAS